MPTFASFLLFLFAMRTVQKREIGPKTRFPAYIPVYVKEQFYADSIAQETVFVNRLFLTWLRKLFQSSGGFLKK